MLQDIEVAPSDDPARTQHVKNFKTLGIAGGLVAAALVGGTLISAALAAPSAPGPSSSGAALANGEYCQAWQEAFAKELGVSVDDLLPAAKAASIAAIDAAVAGRRPARGGGRRRGRKAARVAATDAAVAAGDLTEERATALKDKINAADGNGCRFFGHPFGGNGHGGGKAPFRGPLRRGAAGAP